MSTNLYWYPIVPKKGYDLDDALKFSLRKRFGGSVGAVLSEGHISYLEGLRDAGIADAQKLIDAINKHGSIQVKEE